MTHPAGRELLVLRHARSAWPEDVPDRDRPLRSKGAKAARRVGRFLHAHDLVPDAAVASPARRAVDTARLALEAAGADLNVHLDERLYGPDAQVAVDGALGATVGAGGHHARRLLVVGHEPEMCELVARLTGAQIHLPTAALAHLVLHEGHGGRGVERGRLLLLVAPKLLPRH